VVVDLLPQLRDALQAVGPIHALSLTEWPILPEAVARLEPRAILTADPRRDEE